MAYRGTFLYVCKITPYVRTDKRKSFHLSALAITFVIYGIVAHNEFKAIKLFM